MLLKKSNLLLSSYSGLQCLNQAPHGGPRFTSYTSGTPKSGESSQGARGQRRCYADVAREGLHDLPWPETNHPASAPSPYQIFCQSKGAPYSKRRFYELVKLYHPDRHGQDRSSPVCHLSRAIKLERYRLVVAANDILSNPIKRSAYDRYGAGWNGFPEVSGRWTQNQTGYGGFEDGWGHEGKNGESPSQNATWEDWERWYQRDAKGPQQPVYVGNGAFVGLIVVLAALGGVGQATRAGSYGMTLLEERDRLHDETSKELNRRRREAAASAHRDDRIDTFLRMRDPDADDVFGHEEPGFGVHRRGIGDLDSSLCSSRGTGGGTGGATSEIQSQRPEPHDPHIRR